jgi:YidC/Oxa1 family membrane protein insertase
MDQEKRLLLAFVLSFGVLLLWRAYFVKVMPPPPSVPTPAVTAQRPQPESNASAAPSVLPIKRGTQAQEIILDGDLYRVTVDTRGAVVKSWILKKYRDSNEQPLDVVDWATSQQLGFPMSFSLPDPDLTNRLNDAIYVVSPRDVQLRAPAAVEFIYSDGKIEARKKFSFGPGYEIHTEISVFDGRRYLPAEVAWPGGFGDHSLPAKLKESRSRAVYGSPGDLTTVAEDKIKQDRTIGGPLTLAGLEDLYFAGIFLPDTPADVVFQFGRRSWTPPDWKEKEPPRSLMAVLGESQPKPLGFQLIVAPKDLDVLRAQRPPLDGLVDFGWFSFIAKPLFIALRYIYDHWIHNYGWAIIILTVLLNTLLFPLKLKSIRSAQEMQKVAPLVKSIQERYKQYKFNDPRKQRMQQEIMKLYQEHGINPLGGCLPMVLQLPLLYGFYELLLTAIELRHAPWIGCVRDLSMPDKCHLFGIPLAILPTVMIITMFILQKMTPVAATDPAQQRMMLFMPLVFGVIFYNLASGLVLYYLTANVVGIAQQYFLNRRIPAPQSGSA